MHSFEEKLRFHLHAHALRRYGRGRGLFSAGFGGGGRGFRTGRKLGADDLQLLILALLEEQPRHGYEVIKSLEERSGGFYSPSPGMVYPALTYLEEIGRATVEAEGAKKLYRITDEGRAELERGRAVAESLLTQLEHIGRKMERVRQVFTGEEADDEELASRSTPEVRQARRELRAALSEKRHARREEQERIAGILQRAADEIRRA
jgi:DNA-binding PadR family transcriptional regulator